MKKVTNGDKVGRGSKIWYFRGEVFLNGPSRVYIVSSNHNQGLFFLLRRETIVKVKLLKYFDQDCRRSSSFN